MHQNVASSFGDAESFSFPSFANWVYCGSIFSSSGTHQPSPFSRGGAGASRVLIESLAGVCCWVKPHPTPPGPAVGTPKARQSPGVGGPAPSGGLAWSNRNFCPQRGKLLGGQNPLCLWRLGSRHRLWGFQPLLDNGRLNDSFPRVAMAVPSRGTRSSSSSSPGLEGLGRFLCLGTAVGLHLFLQIPTSASGRAGGLSGSPLHRPRFSDFVH